MNDINYSQGSEVMFICKIPGSEQCGIRLILQNTSWYPCLTRDEIQSSISFMSGFLPIFNDVGGMTSNGNPRISMV